MSELRSENPKNGLSALGAFFKAHKIPRGARGAYDYVFEHGQLWIIGRFNGGQWSVNDAEGPGSEGEFDFECATVPAEEAS
ncbi:MAG: hypothetical protein PHF64_00275 [Methanoregula sp.]|jgi:hypothetical protein|nr:hypothetical protein [Methanoregula sp.]